MLGIKKPLAKKEAMTGEEKNALHQIAKFDKHFHAPGTICRLDNTYTNKDGTKSKRFIVSQNGKENWKAKFSEKDKGQKFEQMVSIKRTVAKGKV